MRRRDFIKAIGGSAAAWPLAARGQQPAMPAIGFMNVGTPEGNASLRAAFRQGLSETGYIEEQNVTIEYHWAEGQYDRLPALAADLVRRQVAVIAATSTPAALAAKAATATIPIVFETAGDPIKLGLVASLNRPGRNATGVNLFTQTVEAKKLELLGKLLPAAATIAFLSIPNNAEAPGKVKEMREAASTLGRQLHLLTAGTENEIDATRKNRRSLR